MSANVPVPHCPHVPPCRGNCLVASASDEFLADALRMLEKDPPLHGTLGQTARRMVCEEIARRKKMTP